MKLPERLKIGGHEYDIIFPYAFKERTDILGQCDFDLKELRISEIDGGGNIRVDSAILVTFIHEILHAIDFQTGEKIFNTNEGEKWIEGISEGLYQVLNDNKLIFHETAQI